MPNATAVREHPLVLDAAQVRALLAGEKTQHRVPVTRFNTQTTTLLTTPLVFWESLDLARAYPDPGPSPAGNPGPYLKAPHVERDTFHDGGCWHRLYSRVQVGDTLWVREAWAAFLPCGLRKQYYRTGVMKHEPLGTMGGRVVEVVYRADGEDVTRAHPQNATAEWKRARHMPRWASRLTLEVTELRVHHLQLLADDEVRAEGVACHACGRVMDGRSEADCHCYHQRASISDFVAYWDTAYYARGLGWDTNPWVWCYTFRRVEA